MRKRPRSFLAVTKKIGSIESPVTEIQLEHGVSAGIHLRVLAEGLIPLYEEHEARLERGIRLKEWEEMDYIEKALIVAQRRIRNAAQNLQSEAEIKAMERKTRRKR
jgi:hypothetical protein